MRRSNMTLEDSFTISKSSRLLSLPSIKKQRSHKQKLEKAWVSNFQYSPSKNNERSHKSLRELFESPIYYSPEGIKLYLHINNNRRIKKYKELDIARLKYLNTRCKSLLKNNFIAAASKRRVMIGKILKGKYILKSIKRTSNSSTKRVIFNSGEADVTIIIIHSSNIVKCLN